MARHISVLPGENFAQYEERRSAELTRSSEELMNPNSKFNEYINDGDWVVKLRAKLNKSSIYNLKNYTNSIACAEYKNNGYSDADCLKGIFSYRKGEKPKTGSVVFGLILLFFLLYVLFEFLMLVITSDSEEIIYTYLFFTVVIPMAIIFFAIISKGNKLPDNDALAGLIGVYGTIDDDGNLHVSQTDYDRYKMKREKENRRDAKRIERQIAEAKRHGWW